MRSLELQANSVNQLLTYHRNGQITTGELEEELVRRGFSWAKVEVLLSINEAV